MSTSTDGTLRSTSSAVPPFVVGMSRTTYVVRSGWICTSSRCAVTACVWSSKRHLGERDDAEVDIRMRHRERRSRQSVRLESERADRHAVLAERQAGKMKGAVGSACDTAGGSAGYSIGDVDGG